MQTASHTSRRDTPSRAIGSGLCDAPRGASATPLDGPALGIYGKYSPALQASRREKYQLQNAARKLRQGFPVTRCLRWAIPHSHISIFHATEFGKAFYAGLETCGSVWECPVCAAKISERRRVEVLAAMTTHKASGGQVLLLTLTNPHYFGDDLPSLLAGQAQAMRRFWSTRAAKRLQDSMGFVGSIRALEVTHGSNGWHPHFHILLFVDRGLDLDRIRREFFAMWSNCCRLAGLPAPSFKHGVTVEDGSKAEKYVSKWGLENEMTKGHIKKGKAKGRTPFDLLRDYDNKAEKQAGALYVEYCTAFKGKRQLVWSNGLKAHFAIDEINDQELAEREEENAQLGQEISRDDWKVILSFGVRAEILEAYENGGAFEVAQCLAILRGEVPLPGEKPDTSFDLGELADWMNWTPERLAEFEAWRVSEAACRS